MTTTADVLRHHASLSNDYINDPTAYPMVASHVAVVVGEGEWRRRHDNGVGIPVACAVLLVEE